MKPAYIAVPCKHCGTPVRIYPEDTVPGGKPVCDSCQAKGK